MGVVRVYHAADRLLIYGYTDNSNHNSYHYKREGILSQIPSLRLLKGALVIKKKILVK